MTTDRSPFLLRAADFPRLGKRLVRSGAEAQVVDVADLTSFW